MHALFVEKGLNVKFILLLFVQFMWTEDNDMHQLFVKPTE